MTELDWSTASLMQVDYVMISYENEKGQSALLEHDKKMT